MKMYHPKQTHATTCTAAEKALSLMPPGLAADVNAAPRASCMRSYNGAIRVCEEVAEKEKLWTEDSFNRSDVK